MTKDEDNQIIEEDKDELYEFGKIILDKAAKHQKLDLEHPIFNSENITQSQKELVGRYHDRIDHHIEMARRDIEVMIKPDVVLSIEAYKDRLRGKLKFIDETQIELLSVEYIQALTNEAKILTGKNRDRLEQLKSLTSEVQSISQEIKDLSVQVNEKRQKSIQCTTDVNKLSKELTKDNAKIQYINYIISQK